MTNCMMLLPPGKDVCQVCATDHEKEQPHNAHSFYYMVKFKMENDREVTWKDAMMHCTDEVKAFWIDALKAKGVSLN